MTGPLDHIRALGPVFVDPWVAVDTGGRIVEYNPHFRALFSRQQARKLQGSPFDRYLTLDLGDGDGDLPTRCLDGDAPLRYDEIAVQIEGEEAPRPFIVSAAPVGDGDDRLALILLRDVGDAAAVQRKYKTMLDEETRQRERLRDEIGRKTKELMDTNIELNRTQKELMRFKKGLYG